MSGRRALIGNLAMPRTFAVRIDLERLRTNLSRQESRELLPDEVLTWLREAGFEPLEQGFWQVREPDLGQVEPDEVLEARVLTPPPPD